MFIPKGQLFIGRAHRVGHRIQLVTGKAFLIEEKGKVLKQAGDEIVSVPGYMTCAFTLTDVFANTYHPNPQELRDVSVLEEEIFEPVKDVLAVGRVIAEGLQLREAV